MKKESKFSLEKKINKKFHELKFVCINCLKNHNSQLSEETDFLKKLMTKNEDQGLGLKLIAVNGKSHGLVGLVNASHFQICLKKHNFKPF